MVQIAGKYQIVESHNFTEFLIRGGVPEEKAKIASDAKTVLELTIDGKKIILQSDENLGNHTTELILGEESEEKLPTGTIKSTSKLDENVLTVESIEADGTPKGKRTYTFSDTGLEIVYVTAKDNFTAKRVYKRI